MGQRCVLATGNPGKLAEIRALLEGLPWEIVAQSEFGVESPPESGGTFVENAILKARQAAHMTGLAAIADDSGIEVDALNGAPGIHSARYSGEDASDAKNVAKLLRNVASVPAELRTARFQCVVVMMRHAADPTPVICSGTWEGRVIEKPCGDNGFGYDPIFWLPDQERTAAELEPALKNRLSHRGQALRALRAVLRM